MNRNGKLLTTADLLRQKCQRALANHRRRAKADGQRLGYNLHDLLYLAKEYPRCVYCTAPLALDFEFDHAQPTSRNGKYTAANLRVCCGRCNSLKGRWTAESFCKLLALLADVAPVESEDLCRRALAGSTVYARGRRERKGV